MAGLSARVHGEREEFMDAEDAIKTAPSSDLRDSPAGEGTPGAPIAAMTEDLSLAEDALLDTTATPQGSDPESPTGDAPNDETVTVAENAAPMEALEAPPKRRRNDGPTMIAAETERKLREAEKKWSVVGPGGRVLPKVRSSSASSGRGAKPAK